MPKPRFALATAASPIDSPTLNELAAACAPSEECEARFAALLAHLREHATALH